MKALTTAGLTKLIQLIKSSFISVNDTVTTNTVTLADVATSGDYDDLTNKPTIPTNYVTTDTAQNITARKTFFGEKAIYFKQNATANKLGFTLYNPSNTELGAFEYRPNTISTSALLNVNCSYSGSDYVGFRYWGTAVNIIAPKVATAGNFYIPVNFTDGTNTVTATNVGTVDISSLLPDVSNFVTSSTLTTTLADYQPLLVSGTNIKTINNENILGSGNIDIQGGISTIEGIAPIEVSDAPTTYAPSDYISYSDGTISSNWSGLTSPHQGEDFYIDIVFPADVNINALNDYWYIGNKDNAQQLGFRYYDISQYYENYIFYEIFDDNNNKISRLWYGSKDFRAGNDTSVPTMSTDGSIDGVYVFGVYHNAGETTSYLINSSESTDNNVSSGLTITNSRLNKIRLYYSPRQLGNGFATDNNNIWACICDKSQIGGYGSLQETAILNSLKLYTSPTDTTGIELIREGIADGYSIKLNIGEGLAVDNNNLISLGYTQAETDSLLSDKQDILTVGDGISISGGTTTLANNFTGDSPLITCDSTESGYPAYYAFDGNADTYWGGVNTGEHWITRQHNSIVVKSVSVSFREYSERFTQGEIQGSNDGTTFTTIASFSNNENTSIIIDCSSNTTAYTYTRLVGTTTDSGWGKVGEMVIGYETPSVISVNSTIARTSQIPTVDQTYDGTSTNAQSGVAIEGELANYLSVNDTVTTQTVTLATVATSGSYNDLSNKPTIPTVDQTYDGTSANAQSGVAIEGAGFLKNTAIFESSLTIMGSPTSSSGINIGNGTIVTGQAGIAIGLGSASTKTQATGDESIAIGLFAQANNELAIQLGRGTNSTAHSLQIGSYQLLNTSTGYIPNARIDMDNVPTNISAKPVTSGGVYTALSNKQDTISDLATIRSGASAGATAVQPSDITDVVKQETTDTISLYGWHDYNTDETVYTKIETPTTGDAVYNSVNNQIGTVSLISDDVIQVNNSDWYKREDTSYDTVFIRSTLTDNNSNALNITQADGQWVQSFVMLMASSGTKNGVQVDLSNYLPNDNYNYDVKFKLGGYDDDSSYYYHIETDIFDDGDTSTGNSDYLQLQGGTYSRQNINIFDLPVGTGRFIKVYGSGADYFRINALGYRRLGTNN